MKMAEECIAEYPFGGKGHDLESLCLWVESVQADALASREAEPTPEEVKRLDNAEAERCAPIVDGLVGRHIHKQAELRRLADEVEREVECDQCHEPLGDMPQYCATCADEEEAEHDLVVAKTVQESCVHLACDLCRAGCAFANPGENPLYHAFDNCVSRCGASNIINADLAKLMGMKP